MGIKALKFSSDLQDLPAPEEFDPTADIIAVAGVDLEDLNTHKILRSTNDMTFEDPNAGLQTLSQLALDEKAKVSLNDTTPGYLNGKLIAGTNIVFTENNDGANETLEISSNITETYLTISCVAQGNANNTWMSISASSITINNTRLLLPYNCELIGFVFSNSNNNGDTDIEIYKNGVTATELVTTIQVRNARYAWSSQLTPTTFNAGDRIAVYLRDQGGNISSAYVGLYFKISNQTTSAGSGNI